MKKNKNLLILSALGITLALASCGGGATSSSSSKESASSASESSLSKSSEESTSSEEFSTSQESPISSEEFSSDIMETIVITGPASVAVGSTVELASSITGVKWASSDSKVATIDNKGALKAVEVGKVTITANKNGYAEGFLEIEVVEQSDINIKDLGLLAGTFVSKAGMLSASADGYTYAFFGSDKIPLYLTATRISEEKVRHNNGPITMTEYVQCVRLLDETTKKEYRLHFSLGSFKTAILEERNEEGVYEEVDELMPYTQSFAGSFNLYQEYNFDPSTFVYNFSGEFDPGLGGYPVTTYIGNRDYLKQNSWALETGYYDDGEELKLSFVIRDSSDGEYFEGIFYNAETGIAAVDESGEDYIYWYPDFSILSESLVDDEGNDDGDYSYDADENMLYNSEFEEVGKASFGHDEYGWYTLFTSEDSVDSLRLEFTADVFRMTYGAERGEDAEYQYLAPKFTFFDIEYAYIEYGYGYDFKGETYFITFGMETDYDTWEDTVAVILNNEKATDILLKADRYGTAYLTFAINDNTYTLTRYFQESVAYLSDGTSGELVYNLPLLNEIYVDTFIAAAEGKHYSINVDYVDENLQVEEVSGEDILLSLAHYEFIPQAERVVLTSNNMMIVPLNQESGLFLYCDGEGKVIGYAIKGNLLKKGIGNYVYYEDLLTFGGDYGESLSLNDNNLEYETTFLLSGAGVVPAFEVMDSNVPTYYAIEGRPVVRQIGYLADGSFGLKGTFLERGKFFEMAGDFIFINAEGVQEHLQIGADGKLLLDTYADENKTALAPVEYTYHFDLDEHDNPLLIAHIPSDTGMGYLTFTFNGYGFSLNNSSIVYVRDYLAIAQGVYFGGGHVLVINGDSVVFDGTNIAEPLFTKVNEDTYLAFKVGEAQYGYLFQYYEGRKIVMFMDQQTGTNSEVSQIAFNMADYVGEYKIGEDVYSLQLTEFGYQLKKNGAFYSSVYVLVDYDGHFAVKFRAPFGNVILYEAEPGAPITAVLEA